MVKYVGENHLDSNFYNQIFIIQDGDYIEVKTVNNDSNRKNLDKLDTLPITSQIENLDDYHKIEEIVSYFLRSNTICQIAMDSNNNLVITSTSSRQLILEVDIEYEKIEKMIIDKYSIDRLKFIDISTKNYIYFTTVNIDDDNIVYDVSNYYEGVDRVNHALETIVLTLMTDESGVAEFDKTFMIKYIKEILYNTCEKAEVWDDTTKTGIELRLHNKKIRIPEIFKEEVYFLVYTRNSEINEMNQKQYKLEGIK